jgi:hypothetical protein
MNKKLLLKVAEAIQKHPTQFQMGAYFSRWLDLPNSPEAGGCGTAACIAGWTCHIALGQSRTLDDAARHLEAIVGQEAARVLDITADERQRLFVANHWPASYYNRYDNALTPEEQAAAAVARIKHFIKTEGRE